MNVRVGNEVTEEIIRRPVAQGVIIVVKDYWRYVQNKASKNKYNYKKRV